MLITIAAIWVVAYCVGTLAPVTILQGAGALRAYVDWVNYVVPVWQYGKRSSFPEIATLYHAIAWLTFPLWFILVYRTLHNPRVIGGNGRPKGLMAKTRAELGVRGHFALLCIVLLFPLLATAAVWLNEGQDTRLVAFGTSRDQLAFFGIAWPMAAGVFLATGIVALKKLFVGRPLQATC